THGPGVLRELVRAARDRPFDRAWREVTGTTLERAETDWRRASLIRYRWIPLLATSSSLWLAITLLSLVVGVRKRALARRVRERWEQEEKIGENDPNFFAPDDDPSIADPEERS